MIIHQTGCYSNIQRELYHKLKDVTGTLNFVKLNDYEEFHVSTNLLNISSTNCVEYSIRNVEIIQNNSLVSSPSFYLNFDIAIRSQDESFNLHSTEIAMAYSTSLFGDSIVSNNKIYTDLGSDFNNYSIKLSDQTSDKVKIVIEVLPNSQTLEINSFKDDLYHASLLIENFDLSEILSLSVDENFDLVTYQETSNGFAEIECNEYNEDINITLVQLLPPEITNYNQSVYAGTKTLLTIEGENLLNLNGNTEVWFYNANDGSIIEWIKPYNGDYIYPLSSNKIEVYVPSYALNADSGINQNKEYAGSGKFKVVHKDFNGVITQQSDEKDIVVVYAVRNGYYDFGPNGSITQPVLLKEESASNGYIVTFTSQFANLQDDNNKYFKNAVSRALNTWCSQTGLNFIIDENAFQNGGNYDLLIDYGSTNNPNALASTLITSISNSDCEITIDNSSSNHPELHEVDLIEKMSIVFNSDWDISLWDAENLNASPLFSVERTALHELGHAHGILHTRNTEELMYYSPNPTITTITAETKSASNYIQEHSSKQTCEDKYEKTTSCTTSTMEFTKDMFVHTWYSNKRLNIECDDLPLISGISVYNVEGKLISNFKTDGLTKSFPMHARSGVYYISILTDKGLYSDSFIIVE